MGTEWIGILLGLMFIVIIILMVCWCVGITTDDFKGFFEKDGVMKPDPVLFIDPVADGYVTRIRVHTRTTKAGEIVDYIPEILYTDVDIGDVWVEIDMCFLYYCCLTTLAKNTYPDDEDNLAYARYAIDYKLHQLNGKRVVSETNAFIKHP